MPIELIQVGLGLLVLGLLFGAWMSQRTHVEPLGYWPLGWALLVGAGAARVASAPDSLEYIVGALFSGLVLAGAYRYVGRDVPSWLFPLFIGVGFLDLVLELVGLRSVAQGVATAFEPMGMVAAVRVVMRARATRTFSTIDRMVPGALFALAMLDVYDSIFLTGGTDAIGIWLTVGIPVATIQAMASFDRIRTHADEIAGALEESVSLLRATLESTADGILVVDRNGNFTSFNRSFGEMWHIPRAILERGQSEFALHYAMQQLKDPEAFHEKVQELYAQPEVESFETLEFKDGRVFERYSRPQRVGDEVVGRVWSFRDITERRRAEALAARHQNHLEELVEERTRELLESRDRLRQADRLATVGTLAAGVAHQINNPIGSILNSAEYALLCENDDDAHAVWRRALEVNADEARRCAAIVRSMLQFARDEPVSKRIEDLNDVVQRACRAASAYARDRAAEIEVELSSSSLPVRMSPIEIEQVMVNLLQNAVESRERGVRIGVRSERKGDVARIHVIDNGSGIEPEDVGRIFDPFFSTRLQDGGTGLGLSVAHGIVSEHAGEIRVESDPEKGTSILIELPVCEDRAAEG